MDDPGARTPVPTPADIRADAARMDAQMTPAQRHAMTRVVRAYIARHDPDLAARMSVLSPYATLAAFLTSLDRAAPGDMVEWHYRED